MRNLLWTATAVLVMLVGGSNVMAQVAPTVQAKVNAVANPPAGKADVYATGNHNIPANQVKNKVVASWYKQDAATGNLVFVGTTDDLALARLIYVTSDIRVDKLDGAGAPQKYTVIVQVYVDGPGGANNPVAWGPPGVQTNFVP